MNNRMLMLLTALTATCLTGCNQSEGVTFVKNPDNPAEILTPPDWAVFARNDIQSGLAISLFTAECKLLYRGTNWFVGCRPKKEQAPFMLYSVQQDNAENGSFIVTAINKPAKQYAHQNLLLRQIVTTSNAQTAFEPERLKQDFEALSGA